jgi:hypothetical protein
MLKQRADPFQPELDGPVLVAERIQEADRIWVWRAQRVSLKIAMVAKPSVRMRGSSFSPPRASTYQAAGSGTMAREPDS